MIFKLIEVKYQTCHTVIKLRELFSQLRSSLCIQPAGNFNCYIASIFLVISSILISSIYLSIISYNRIILRPTAAGSFLPSGHIRSVKKCKSVKCFDCTFKVAVIGNRPLVIQPVKNLCREPVAVFHRIDLIFIM